MKHPPLEQLQHIRCGVIIPQGDFVQVVREGNVDIRIIFCCKTAQHGFHLISGKAENLHWADALGLNAYIHQSIKGKLIIPAAGFRIAVEGVEEDSIIF